MKHIDNKYIMLMSNTLRNFKRKTSTRFECSCPICGDSESNKYKARGNFYENKGVTLYHCYNCNVTMSVENFLKTVVPTIYSEYMVEKLKDSVVYKSPEQYEIKKPKYEMDAPLRVLKKISQLEHNHPFKEYVVSRKIPTNYHHKLFYCPRFYQWVNKYLEVGKFPEGSLKYDHPRLIIPLINKNNELHGVQGRCIDDSITPKYITLVTNETIPKIYGLDTLDFRKPINVFEGPIDSMFIPNSIATCGGDLSSFIKFLEPYEYRIIYDNEPRKKDTPEKIEKAIDRGCPVVIFPDDLEGTDINKMVLNGMSVDKIVDIIDKNIYKGLLAKLRLSSWRKI